MGVAPEAKSTSHGGLGPRATLPEKQGIASSPSGDPSSPAGGGLLAGDGLDAAVGGGGGYGYGGGTQELEPLLSILGGIGCGAFLVTTAVFIAMRLRCLAKAGSAPPGRHRPQSSSSGPPSPGSPCAGGGRGRRRRDKACSTWVKSDSNSSGSSVGTGASVGGATGGDGCSTGAATDDTDLLQASPVPPADPCSSVMLLETSDSQASLHHPLLLPPSSSIPKRGMSSTLGRPPHQQHQQRRHRADGLPAPPPPPPRTSASSSTLPRFHHHQQLHYPHGGGGALGVLEISGRDETSLQLLQNGSLLPARLPSPPEPPASFRLSALALDIPLAAGGDLLPPPPLDCDIVLPPPAESLYTLPRKPGGKASRSSSVDDGARLKVRFREQEKKDRKKGGKGQTESVV